MKRWMTIVLLALVLTVVVLLAITGLPESEPVRYGVEAPIPEDAAPVGVSRFAEWNLAVHTGEMTPNAIKRVYGGQTIRLQVVAWDFGAGDGWTFEIPGMNVSERVAPGEPLRFEVTPVNYNNYQVFARSGDIEHSVVLIVGRAE